MKSVCPDSFPAQQVLRSNGLLAIVASNACFHELLGCLRRLAGISDPYGVVNSANSPFQASSRRTICVSTESPPGYCIDVGFQVVRSKMLRSALSPGFHWSAARLLMFWMSLHYLILRRVLVGYSTLLLARKVGA
jgi:hypothetical protein